MCPMAVFVMKSAYLKDKGEGKERRMAQEILWKGDIASSLEMAKASKKHLFLDFSHAPQ